MISLKYLNEALLYNAEAASLTWRHDRPLSHFKTGRAWNIYKKRDAGNPAGSIWSSGYRGVCVGRTNLLAHRVIYAMHNSIEPCDLPDIIDHKDGDILNNRIDNLRPATTGQNMHNRRLNENNTSGHKGVSFKKKTKRWVANIRVDGVKIHLGYFDTAEEAGEARKKAASELHGDFARHATTPTNDNAKKEAAA